MFIIVVCFLFFLINIRPVLFRRLDKRLITFTVAAGKQTLKPQTDAFKLRICLMHAALVMEKHFDDIIWYKMCYVPTGFDIYCVFLWPNI